MTYFSGLLAPYGLALPSWGCYRENRGNYWER